MPKLIKKYRAVKRRETKSSPETKDSKVVIATIAIVVIFTLLMATKPTNMFLTNYVGKAKAMVLSFTSSAFSGNLFSTAVNNSLLITTAISLTNVTETSIKSNKTNGSVSTQQHPLLHSVVFAASGPYTTIGSCGSPCTVDTGGTIPLSVQPFGGTFPQNCGIVNVTGNSRQGGVITVFSTSNPATFSFTAGRSGTFVYEGICTDSESPGVTTTSGPITIIVPSSGGGSGFYTTIGSCGSPCTVTSGQNIPLSVQPFDGTYPVYCGIVNVTGNDRQGGVTTLQSSGNSAAFSFVAGRSGTFQYEGICTDSGSGATTVTSNPITVIVGTGQGGNPPPSSTLGFSIYTTSSTYLSLYKGFYSNAGAQDVLIDDSYNPNYRYYLQYWNNPQTFPRMILGNNYTQITSTSVDGFSNIGLAKEYNFGSSDYIVYDAENWVKTPSWEQDDQSYWVNEICNSIHAAGYKCGWTPQLGGGPGAGQFESINWANVDYVGLLEQGRSSVTQQLIQNVTHLAGIAISGNPNIKVWVDLDISPNPVGAPATLQELEADISALGNVRGVDGVTLVCQPTCNTTEMTTLVNYIKSTQ